MRANYYHAANGLIAEALRRFRRRVARWSLPLTAAIAAIALIAGTGSLTATLPVQAAVPDGVTILETSVTYDTLVAAVAAAADGQILSVADGTYDDGDLLIDKAITIQGVTPQAAMIHGAITVTADGVTIDGVTLDGNGGAAVLAADGVSNLTLTDNRIRNGSNGLAISGSVDHVTVVNNVFEDIAEEAVSFSGAGNILTISGNSFTGSTYAIALWGDAAVATGLGYGSIAGGAIPVAFRDVTIASNTFSPSITHAIYADAVTADATALPAGHFDYDIRNNGATDTATMAGGTVIGTGIHVAYASIVALLNNSFSTTGSADNGYEFILVDHLNILGAYVRVPAGSSAAAFAAEALDTSTVRGTYKRGVGALTGNGIFIGDGVDPTLNGRLSANGITDFDFDTITLIGTSASTHDTALRFSGINAGGADTTTVTGSKFTYYGTFAIANESDAAIMATPNYFLRSDAIPFAATDINGAVQYEPYYLDAALTTLNTDAGPTEPTDEEAVAAAELALTWDDIKGANTDSGAVTEPLNLITEGEAGTTIAWQSLFPDYLHNDGTIVRGGFDRYVEIDAIISRGTASTTKNFGLVIMGVVELADDAIALDFDAIRGDNASTTSVTSSLNLPTVGAVNSSTITWESDNEAVIATDGTVTPASTDTVVTLVATLTFDGAIQTKAFVLTVPGSNGPLTDEEAVATAALDLTWDTIKGDNVSPDAVTQPLNLVTSGSAGTVIEWSADNEERILLIDGTVIPGLADEAVTLTATISRGTASTTEIYGITVLGSTVVSDDVAALTFDLIKGSNTDPAAITTNLSLITTGPNGSSISWTSSNEAAVTTDGTVVRGEIDRPVTLTALITDGLAAEMKTFDITVAAAEQGLTDELAVQAVLEEITADFILGENIASSSIITDLALPVDGPFGVGITWYSSATSTIAADGTVTRGANDTPVTVTAVASRGAAQAAKTIDLIVLGTGTGPSEEYYIAIALEALSWSVIQGENTEPQRVTANLDLPISLLSDPDLTLLWESTHEDIIDPLTGIVHRPGPFDETTVVVLNVVVTRHGVSGNKEFIVTVPKQTIITNLNGDLVITGTTTPGTIQLPADVTEIRLNATSTLSFTTATTTIDAVLIGTSPASTTQSIGDVSVLLTKQVQLLSGQSGADLHILNDDEANLLLAIPDGTTVYAPEGWDGRLLPPRTIGGGGTPPAGYTLPATVVSLGSADTALVFDTLVKVTLTGVTGPIAYRTAGSDAWHLITTVCDSAAPTNVTFPGECIWQGDGNTVIWTYHLTDFAAMTAVPANTGSGSGSSNGGSSGSGSGGSGSGSSGGNSGTPLYLLDANSSATANTTSPDDTAGTGSGSVLGEQAEGPSQLAVITDDVTLILRNDATFLADMAGVNRSEPEEFRVRGEYLNRIGATSLSAESQEAIAIFITYGTPTTYRLGAGERAGILNSYRAAFGHLPGTQTEWEDALKVAGGRWPSERSINAEQAAISHFMKIYRRMPNRANVHDDAAVTVIAYGLRPAQRNLQNEAVAIRTFTSIYKAAPQTAIDWDLVRAIAYSGATR